MREFSSPPRPSPFLSRFRDSVFRFDVHAPPLRLESSRSQSRHSPVRCMWATPPIRLAEPAGRSLVLAAASRAANPVKKTSGGRGRPRGIGARSVLSGIRRVLFLLAGNRETVNLTTRPTPYPNSLEDTCATQRGGVHQGKGCMSRFNFSLLFLERNESAAYFLRKIGQLADQNDRVAC